MKIGCVISTTVLAVCVLSACDKAGPPAAPAAAEPTVEAAPVPPPKFAAATRLDPNGGGVTGGAIVEVNQNGHFRVTDSNAADHATKFWSLSDVAANSNYQFQIRVKKDPASAAAGLLQIDMQSGTAKDSFECAFSSKDGLLVGRKAAAAPASYAVDDGDAWIFDCPAKSGKAVDAVYAYIFPSVGGDPGSYDNTFTGSLNVTDIGYTRTAAPPATASIPSDASPN